MKIKNYSSQTAFVLDKKGAAHTFEQEQGVKIPWVMTSTHWDGQKLEGFSIYTEKVFVYDIPDAQEGVLFIVDQRVAEVARRNDFVYVENDDARFATKGEFVFTESLGDDE